MTNKEAIGNLKDIKKIIYEVFPITEEDKELSLDLAIKAIRIVEVIEYGFKRDGNMIDADDWEDIKKFVEQEAENEQIL